MRYPSPPAWYLLGGKAIHRATEWYDTDQPADWELALELEIKAAEEIEPDQSKWLAAGYGAKKQRFDHWVVKGQEHVWRWIDFRQENPNLTVVAVEEEVSHGEGTSEIKAFIDRVFLDEDTGEYLLVDIKSSSKRPESTQQLGIYRALWNLKHPDQPVTKGQYFMTKDGGLHPKEPDLSMWTLDTLDKLGYVWNRTKEHKIYLPVMQSGCDTCSVRPACFLLSGDTPTTRAYDDLNPHFKETSE